jgi:hypothetical protein
VRLAATVSAPLPICNRVVLLPLPFLHLIFGVLAPRSRYSLVGNGSGCMHAPFPGLQWMMHVVLCCVQLHMHGG